MFKNTGKYFVNLHGAVELNLAPYVEVLEQINRIDLTGMPDERLKELAAGLKNRARSGCGTEELVTEGYAIVREAARRVLGMRPYDVQVLAAVALNRGRIVEMQTGEGKTLAATMPVFVNALAGRGVHVLTFNDYLARRDRAWMGPVYEFLGLTVGYVQEGMSLPEKKRAYAADITYVTAREVGFDYLRDFLRMDPEELVLRPFHFALVDEADSILIDEARIPLVIAGEEADQRTAVSHLPGIVKALTPTIDYEVDRCEGQVFLTDTGLTRVEEMLNCGNLYDPENLELLARLNCALQAELILTRDKDYIIRDGRIEIVDEFTGRVAEKRHWPETLQAAVLAREGLLPRPGGKILDSITVHNFINLYPKLSGMTGTAQPAAAEFYDIYNLPVTVIPTNRPCVRKDYPDLVFTDHEARTKAVIAQIRTAHLGNRPVLVGTASVAESDSLAAELKKAGITCRVLNAKNDEMEAGIIARAGEPGAVTVSTNMAGRGVDIRLGGENEEDRSLVVAAGGLYVIGTAFYATERLDRQLRGRAGRQGDPGQSRFFISLEDDLIRQYQTDSMVQAAQPASGSGEPLSDPQVMRVIAKVRKYADSHHADIRRQLYRYSYVLEHQRRIIHQRRREALLGLAPALLTVKAAERYAQLHDAIGEEALKRLEQRMTLCLINKHWSEYLQEMACVRESIHLVVIGRKNPLDEFHRAAITAFAEMNRRIESDLISTFNNRTGFIQESDFSGPASTFTYLLNDNPDQYSNLPFLVKNFVTTISGPVFTISSLINKIANRKT